MTRTFKRAFAALMAMTSLVVSMGSLGASAASWSTPYGTLTGASYNTTWQSSNSPVYRRVSANTTITNAVPNIYAAVEAYNAQGSVVLSNSTTNTNSTSAYTMAQSTAYVNSSLTGQGAHSIWSSSYARQNRYTYF